MQNLEQLRSVHARAQVMEWKNKLPEDKRKEIVSECKRLPLVLRVNGPIAFLLFSDAKEDRAVLLVSKAVLDWLSGPDSPLALRAGVSLPVALSEDRRFYRQALAEAVAYSTWLKRWADATLAVEPPKQP